MDIILKFSKQNSKHVVLCLPFLHSLSDRLNLFAKQFLKAIYLRKEFHLNTNNRPLNTNVYKKQKGKPSISGHLYDVVCSLWCCETTSWIIDWICTPTLYKTFRYSIKIKIMKLNVNNIPCIFTVIQYLYFFCIYKRSKNKCKTATWHGIVIKTIAMELCGI